jgi:7-cyano-7-deazaguanosine (preQ0) biosynthesis protein QueE
MSADGTLVLSEVFGPTYQGEGPHTGQRVAFVRTGGCNLTCAWCDTAYTWDASRYNLREELSRWSVDAIVDKVLAMEPHRVVVSGGEPLLHQHQPGWLDMLEAFNWAKVPMEVETNGTLLPTEPTALLVNAFNVSPKLAHAGDPESLRINRPVLTWLAKGQRNAMKVVVRTAEDVKTAHDLAMDVRWPLERVWVMPEGTTPSTLLARQQELADVALAHHLNMTTRLHVLTWGEERAR